MINMNLIFAGYYSFAHREMIPKNSGIYLFFLGRPLSSDIVDLGELIYIGQSEDLHERICKHFVSNDLMVTGADDQCLYCSYVFVDEKKIDIVENALVYHLQPILNDKLKGKYNYSESIRLFMGGQCGDLSGCSICVDVKSKYRIETYTEEYLTD